MSKAAELAALIGSQSAQSNRNLVINGAMQVSQRGTSDTGVHASGYYSCDRFSVFYSAEDELRNTITQASDGPDGFANSFKIETTTAESAVASDERFYVMYKAEAQDLQSLAFGTSAAKKTTLSFYVKSSVTGTYAVSLYQTDGNDVISDTYTINSANTWERKTITFAGNTAAAIADDNSVGITVYFGIMLGSNYTSGSNSSWAEYSNANFFAGHAQNGVATTTNATWQITGVQWELGEQATPFEHRSYADELERCKRYYQRTTNAGNAYTNLSVVGCYSTGTDQRGTIPFTTEMRTGPALSTSGNLMVLGLGGGLASISAGDGISTHHAGIRVNTNSNLTAGQVAILRGNNDTTAHIQFDAEL